MKSLSLLIIFSLSFNSLYAQVCQRWGKMSEVGQMNPEVINESSGISASRQFADRFYHVNDSGDGPQFYMTDLKGESLRTITVEGIKPRDIEDITVGVYKNKPVLILADIGDNNESRPRISLYIIEEKEVWGESVTPLKVVDLTYPDGSHDCESVAFHPNGDIYFLTKKVDYTNRRAASGGVYAVGINEVMNNPEGQRLEIKKEGELELPFLLYNYNLWGRIPTAMDIHPSGKSFAILTYKAVLNIKKDISQIASFELRKWDAKVDYTLLTTPDLPQQEALTYSHNGESLFFTTEYKKRFNSNPIYRTNCLETLP